MLRAAAIDVGSSATRLSRLTLSHAGIVVQTDLQRFDMRLGADVFGSGHVTPDRLSTFVKLFEQLAHILRKAGITHYRAVATSAMRDAANGPDVCRAVFEATGLNLEIISGQQEGALSRRALVRALGTVDQDALLVDLGGGSLEIERIDGTVSRSVPMGTVRLLSLFEPLRGPLAPEALRLVRHDVLERLKATLGAEAARAPLAIGTGGNLEALAKVLGRTNGLVAQFDTAALPVLAEQVAPMSMAERVSAFHIRPDRADLFLPAVLVLDTLAQLFGVARFVVPRTGLRDALLLDLIEQQTPKAEAPQTPLAQVSLAVFDLSYPLHGLWPPARGVVSEVVRAFEPWIQQARAQGPDAAVFDQVQPEFRALCRASMAHLQSVPPPVLPQALARAAAIVAGCISLGQALVAGAGPTEVDRVVAGLRLDVVGDCACLFTGQALAAHAARPLARALGRPLNLA